MQTCSHSAGSHAGAGLLASLLLLLPGIAKAAPSNAPTPPVATTSSPALQLHVPSPDWRDQVIYFLLLDRFDDGNPANNDQGHGEFDPGNNAKYSGGDLAGVQRRLDYIKGLGATAVWLTPPVANQWWDGSRGYGGYHGYWAENFKAVDAHNGSLADYQRLSDALHRNGLYLIQDVVVNHTGNFFDVTGAADATAPHVSANRHSVPVPAPSQYPFSLNDASQAAHREAAIYNWTPEIRDFTDHRQETTYQLAGLDDLNTDNPTVRAALRDSYNYWLREIGVDAFRIDTAFHVEPDFFEDFLYSNDASAPGIMKTAEQTGRRQFHVFGEGFGVAPAFDDQQARKVDRYMRAADGRPRLPGMINFPLYGSITDVFARGKPTAELAHRIRSTMTLHANPQLMPSFVDNHDVDRFLAGGNEAGLKQALLLIMTLPGIPTLYYGTEQGFREQRASMFAAGYGASGRDHFNTQAELYRYIQALTTLRREHRLFSRGTPTLLADNPAAAGALAYRMDHETHSALVIFNSSSTPTLLARMATGLPAGTVLGGLFGIDGIPENLVVAHDGSVSLSLPAYSGGVWRVTGERKPVQPTRQALTLDELAQVPYRDDFSISGQARGLHEFKLVVDGDLATAQTVVTDANGNWRSKVRTDSLIQPALRHSLVAWSEEPQIVANVQHFRVDRQWTALSKLRDPTADDHGRNGRYRYPTDPSWNQHRPLDIQEVIVSNSGGSLQIELSMQSLMASWNPPNGFDHLAITAFIELPNQPAGSRVMPLQNSLLPDDMHWHYRLRINGWSNTLFNHHGSSATIEGTAIGSAMLQVDRPRNRIRIQLPATLLANTNQLSGSRIYLTSWDYDGGYKPLAPEPSRHAFGGGEPTAALIMDETAILVLP